MKATTLILTAAIMCGMLRGQNVVYQQAGAISVTTGGAIAASEYRSLAQCHGSPFSGTEQRHSLQVLGDGTRIERNDTSQISRDSEGRYVWRPCPQMAKGGPW